jgi:hypothetical protein
MRCSVLIANPKWWRPKRCSCTFRATNIPDKDLRKIIEREFDSSTIWSPELAAKQVSDRKPAATARRTSAFVIDTARVIAAGFLGTMLGTSALKTESLDIRGILATIISLVTPMDRPTALLVGTVWHCLNGMVFAAIYAKVLVALQRESSVGKGFLLGFALWILLMLMLPILFSVDPSVRSGQMPNPGAFLLSTGMGWAPAFFVLLDHLVYGLLVGIIYRHRLDHAGTQS